jgi:hypothetical protein
MVSRFGTEDRVHPPTTTLANSGRSAATSDLPQAAVAANATQALPCTSVRLQGLA